MSGIITSLAVNTIRTKTRASYIYEIAWAVWNAEEKHIYDIQKARFCPFVFVMEDKNTTIEVCKRNPPFLTDGVKTINRIYLVSDIMVIYPNKRELMTAVRNEYTRIGKKWSPPTQSLKLFSASEFTGQASEEEPAKKVKSLYNHEDECEKLLSSLESREEEREQLKQKIIGRKLSELELVNLLVLRNASFSVPKTMLTGTPAKSPLLEYLTTEEKQELETFKATYIKKPVVLVSFIPIAKGGDKEVGEKLLPEKERTRPKFGIPPALLKRESLPDEEPAEESAEDEDEDAAEETNQVDGTGKEEEQEQQKEASPVVEEEEKEGETPAPSQPTSEEEDTGEVETEIREEGKTKDTDTDVDAQEEEQNKTEELSEVPLDAFTEELLIAFFGFSMGRAFRTIPLNSELIFQRSESNPPTLSALLDILKPGKGLEIFIGLPEKGSLLLKLFRLFAFSLVPPELQKEKEIEKLNEELKDILNSINPYMQRVYEKYLPLYKKEPNKYRYAILVLKVSKAYYEKKKLDIAELLSILFPKDYPDKKITKSDLHRLFLMLRDIVKHETLRILKREGEKITPKALLIEQRLKQVIVIEPEDKDRKTLVPANYGELMLKTASAIAERKEVSRELHKDSNHFRAFLKLIAQEMETIKEPVEFLLKDSHRFRDRLIIPSLFS